MMSKVREMGRGNFIGGKVKFSRGKCRIIQKRVAHKQRLGWMTGNWLEKLGPDCDESSAMTLFVPPMSKRETWAKQAHYGSLLNYSAISKKI